MPQWHRLRNLQTLEAAVFTFGWIRTPVFRATTQRSSPRSSLHCDAFPPFTHHCSPCLLTQAHCCCITATEVRTYFHSPASTLCPLPASRTPSIAEVTQWHSPPHTPYSTHLGRPWLHLFFQRPSHFPQAHWCFNLGDFQNGKLLTEHVQRALEATGREAWVWHEELGPTHTTCFPVIPSLVKPRCSPGWR